MRTCVIGGFGYIGSALCEYLTKIPNHSITCIDKNWFGKPENCAILRIIGDMNSCDLDIYDNIILLAGHSSVAMCQNDMKSSFNNNVRNFVNLLSRVQKDQKFIYASSSSVYGDTGSAPATEQWDRFKPKSYYDLTKQIIDYYAELSNVKYYGLRFGTVNGCAPHVRNDIMINKMVYSGIKTGEITIFNSHVSRPILGINDLCKAVHKIIDSQDDNRGIYNLASFNSTVGDIACNVRNSLSGNIKINDMGNTPSYNFSIDCSKFENTFDFKFSDNVDTIINSFNENNYQLITDRNKKIHYV